MATLDAHHRDDGLGHRRASTISTSSSISTASARTARRTSTSSLLLPSRLPLAPLGPHLTPAFALGEQQQPLSPGGFANFLAKSSASGSAPMVDYSMNDPRSPYGTPGASTSYAPISSPGFAPSRMPAAPTARLQADYYYSARRTSLPALPSASSSARPSLADFNTASPTNIPTNTSSPSTPIASSSTPTVHHYPTSFSSPRGNRLFEQLQSYVLPGSTTASTSQRAQNAGPISPLSENPTTRFPPIASSTQPHASNDDSYASRRPSLPIAIPTSQTPTSTSFRAFSAKPLLDAPSLSPSLPSSSASAASTAASPGAVPSSDPGPIAPAFDLDFIFGERMYPGGPLAPYPYPPPSQNAQPPSAYDAGERRLSVSLDSGVSPVHGHYPHSRSRTSVGLVNPRRGSRHATITPATAHFFSFPPPPVPPLPSSAMEMSGGAGGGDDWEDTFARFVGEGDREYEERRAQWSFVRASPSKTSTNDATVKGKGKGRERGLSASLGGRRPSPSSSSPLDASTSSSSPLLSQTTSSPPSAFVSPSAPAPPAVTPSGGIEPTGVWECGALGRYWVGIGDEDESMGSGAKRTRSVSVSGNAPATNAKAGERRPSLVVRRFPSVVPTPTATTEEGSPSTTEGAIPVAAAHLNASTSSNTATSSAVRIHIHKHSRAPAHSLFLGASNPSAAARSSILLATKKVHLHLSAKKAAQASASASKSRLDDEDEDDGDSQLATPLSPTSKQSQSASQGQSVDISLPRRAPPPGYIPSFVNRELLERASTPSLATQARAHGDSRRYSSHSRAHGRASRPRRASSTTSTSSSSSDSDSEADSSAPSTSSPHRTHPSSSNQHHQHPHHYNSGNLAADFATLSPEAQAALLEQRISSMMMPSSNSGRGGGAGGAKRSLGGRLKAALTGSAPSGLLSPDIPGAEEPQAYQPPWLLMTPGFVKEDNDRKLKNLKHSFQAAGMFTPIPPHALVRHHGQSHSSSHSRERRDRAGSGAVMSGSDDRPSPMTGDETDGGTGTGADEEGFVHVPSGALVGGEDANGGSTSKRSASRLGGGRKRPSPPQSQSQSRSRGQSQTRSGDSTAVDPTSSTGSGHGHVSSTTGSVGKSGKGKAKESHSRSASISLPSLSRSRTMNANASGGEGKSDKEKGKSAGGKTKAKRGQPPAVVLPYRNKVLETVAPDTMCMAVPLWDFRAEEEERRHGTASAAVAATVEGEGRRVKFDSTEDDKMWLLVTYVPFNDEMNRPPAAMASASTSTSSHVKSPATTSSTITSPLGSLFAPSRHAKKQQPRRPSVLSPATTAPPALSLSSALKSSTSSTTPKMIPPLRSFRIVGRIVTTDELRYSGLRFPGADNLLTTPSLARKLNAGKAEEKDPFTAVIAICHDARSLAIEYVPEGLDALGFCGNAPQHVRGAVTPFTFEREVGELSNVGRDVVEICWAGCLALID